MPAVLGVEGDVGRALGEELLHPALGPLVDREGDVAAGAVAGVLAALARAERGQHLLAQVERELERRASRERIDRPAGSDLTAYERRARAPSSTSIVLLARRRG